MDDEEHWATGRCPAPLLPLGAGAVLRRWQLDDLPELHAAVVASREHLAPWMPWAVTAAADDANERGYLERAQDRWEARTTFDYAIVDDGSIAGSCGLMGRVGPAALEIGYWVHVDHTRRGLATRAARALTTAAFAIPGVDRVVIRHDRDNHVSERVPTRLGFIRSVDEEPGSDAPQGSGFLVTWTVHRNAWSGVAAPG